MFDWPIRAARPELREEVDHLDSSHDEANNDAKTPLENLQNILAKADALAAADVPPQTKAVFSIEGDGSEAVVEEEWDTGAGDFRKENEAKSPAPYISKSRLQAILAAVQQFPQEMLSRQRLTDLLIGDLCHSDPAVVKAGEESHREIKIVFPEHIQKLDEAMKSFQKIYPSRLEN